LNNQFSQLIGGSAGLVYQLPQCSYFAFSEMGRYTKAMKLVVSGKAYMVRMKVGLEQECRDSPLRYQSLSFLMSGVHHVSSRLSIFT